MVEPVHIFEGGVLDLVPVAPWSLRADEFCLVSRPMTDYDAGVVVGVAD